jgi:hypothetical protein
MLAARRARTSGAGVALGRLIVVVEEGVPVPLAQKNETLTSRRCQAAATHGGMLVVLGCSRKAALSAIATPVFGPVVLRTARGHARERTARLALGQVGYCLLTMGAPAVATRPRATIGSKIGGGRPDNWYLRSRPQLRVVVARHPVPLGGTH